MEINDKDYVNEKYFSNISNRERAIFEGAISMGALFHQFIGVPVSKKSSNQLKDAIKSSLELQPAITLVEVELDLSSLEDNPNEFEYASLEGNMIDVKIHSAFKDVTAIIRVEFIKELNYPLMYVEKIK